VLTSRPMLDQQHIAWLVKRIPGQLELRSRSGVVGNKRFAVGWRGFSKKAVTKIASRLIELFSLRNLDRISPMRRSIPWSVDDNTGGLSWFGKAFISAILSSDRERIDSLFHSRALSWDLSARFEYASAEAHWLSVGHLTRLMNCCVESVWFWRYGKIYGRLGQRQIAFRHADEAHRFNGIQCDAERAHIRKSESSEANLTMRRAI